MSYNYNNEGNTNRTFGRLRRNYYSGNNEQPVQTYKNVNNTVGNYDNGRNDYSYGKHYQNYEDNRENNSVHSSYQYKRSKPPSENNDYNNNNNYNNNNINRVNTNYSKKNSSKASNENEYVTDEQNLICQNCINEELMDMKRKRDYDERRNDFVPAPFEDKYKAYDLNLINGKIRQREENRNEVANVMNKYKYKDKDRLIYENENSRNLLNERNGNYLYDKFRDKYEQKERMINDNINKFTNKERPEISAYFNNYVNNPNYKNNLEYGEYRKKQEDLDQYRNDLLNQMREKDNRKRYETEEENREAQRQYNKIQRQIEEDNRNNALKIQQQKDDLLRGNLQLIEEKKRRKMEEENEKRLYKNAVDRQYEIDKQNEENKLRSKQKQMNDLLSENLNNIKMEENRKLREKQEDEKYRYNDKAFVHDHELMGRCCKCHRIFPRRLLTVNQHFYRDNRKRNN